MSPNWKHCTGASQMPDDIDWSLTTFEGLRRKQREEFAALSFAEKLERIEQMNEIVEVFDAARGLNTARPGSASGAPPLGKDANGR